MRSQRNRLPSLVLISVSCAAVLLLGLQPRAAADPAIDRSRSPSSGAATAGPPSGIGLQLDFAAGIGRDESTSQMGFTEHEIAVTVGAGLAFLDGPLTAGARMEQAQLILSHDATFYLAEVGAHARAGMFKLSAVAEIGAHHFTDVGSDFEAQASNSTTLACLGLRGSIELAPRRIAPTIGWWAAYRYDLQTATVIAHGPGPFTLGGGFFATGLQIGFDIQPLPAAAGRVPSAAIVKGR